MTRFPLLSPAFALTLIGTSLARPVSAGGGFFILVNRGNATASLTRSELRRTVTGEIKQWDSGAVVQLGIIPGDAPETQYLASLLDTTPREFIARLQEQVFKGELRRPVVLRAPSDCGAFVRSNPGAICVSADSEPVPAEAHPVQIR